MERLIAKGKRKKREKGEMCMFWGETRWNIGLFIVWHTWRRQAMMS